MKKIFFIMFVFNTVILADIKLCVSIPPQAFFVEQIAGDLVDIEVLVKPGSNPSTYTPKPSQLRVIADAKIYFTIGVAFEKSWLSRFSSINKNMLIVDTTEDIEKIPINKHHNHGDHNHGELDPHVWLDPNLVKKQIRVIKDALIKIDKKNSDIYSANYQKFLERLNNIDIKIRSILEKSSKKEFIVFHPSFGYFAKRYNLKQISIEKEGKEPSLKHMKEVIDFAKKENIKRVFVAPQFPQKSAKQIAKLIDGKVVVVDPLSREWDRNILEIANSFGK